METIKLKPRAQDYETREEVKTMRTNLLFCGSDKKVILITSCLAGEGKSTIAMNLAQSLAEIKKKVLLIDVDLRKSVLPRQVEGERPRKGLTHYLSGQASIADIIYLSEEPKFHIIFAGPVPPNPAELLASKSFERLIQKCREAYDYVLLDCAPLGMVVDAAVVAGCSDASILAIESGNISYHFAQGVKQKLENTGCPILGVALNKIDRAKSGRYYGKKYEKYYQKYYESEDNFDEI